MASQSALRTLINAHVELNRKTSGASALFATHRHRLTELICTLGPAGGKVAILGAGNCNDIDLTALVSHFREIHLFDIDGHAIQAAAQRVAAANRVRVVLHGNHDVSGVLPALAQWKRHVPKPSNIEDSIQVALRAPSLGDKSGKFDCILSSCLLTQLILSVVTVLGERHPRCLDVVRAVRVGHIALIQRSLRDRGVGVLASDLVSSDTVPALGTTPAHLLTELMLRLVREKNFFSGTNPFLIEAALKTDPAFAASLCDVRMHEPWLWQIADDRHYLVFALSFRRGPT